MNEGRVLVLTYRKGRDLPNQKIILTGCNSLENESFLAYRYQIHAIILKMFNCGNPGGSSYRIKIIHINVHYIRRLGLLGFSQHYSKWLITRQTLSNHGLVAALKDMEW